MADEKKPEEEKSESTKKQEDWMNSKWRPAMGWMYMMVCVFDFIVFPIMYTIVQFWETEAANDAFRQWQPLTLAGAGLFHMAMGAVLGLSAWGRTQEKLNGANNGGITPPGGTGITPSLTAPSTGGSFSTTSGPSAFTAAPMTSNDGGIVMGPGGKPGPAPLPDPVR